MTQTMTAAQLRDHLCRPQPRAKQPKRTGYFAPLEHDEQVRLMILVGLHVGRWPVLRLLYAVPNGGDRHPAVAAKLRAEGVKRGVPDLCLPVARGAHHGLYVELKRVKGSATSPEQKRWMADLREQGYRVVLCKGADAAWEEIQAYLALERVGATIPRQAC